MPIQEHRQIDTPLGEYAHPARFRTLAIVLISLFLVVFDFFAFNLAAPSIQATLHSNFVEMQASLAAYGMAYAVLLITGGRLGDIAGRKRMFIIGLTGFIGASALCAFSFTPSVFISARILQGAAAAIMQPQVLAIIQVSFPSRERAFAFGCFGGTIGLASLASQLAVGYLLECNLLGLEWRPVFFVHLPLGIAAIISAALLVPESRSPKPMRLDLSGVVLAVATLIALMIPLFYRNGQWPVWVSGSAITFVPLLIAFVRLQITKTRRDLGPLIDLRLFEERSFTVGLIVTVAFYTGLSAFFLVLSVFLQDGLHFTAAQAAGACLPYSIAFLVAGLVSARLFRGLGNYSISICGTAMISGILVIFYLVSTRGANLNAWDLAPAMLLYGFGNGCILPQLNGLALTGAKPENVGSAAGVLTTLQQLACALGVGFIGGLFSDVLHKQAQPQLEHYVRALYGSFLCNILLLTITILVSYYYMRMGNVHNPSRLNTPLQEEPFKANLPCLPGCESQVV